MEKKYQIFVSSTYQDLKEERRAVSSAILDLAHIPSGMELFPASNASQLEYIKKAIDDCDYYIVIVGGKYGSLNEDGLSFTEQEYNYAIEKGLPILAFVNAKVDELPKKHTEVDEGLTKKLDAFRERLMSGRLVKFWSSISDLQSSVITSMTAEFRDNPQEGWTKGEGEISKKALKEIHDSKKSTQYWYAKYQSNEDKLKAYEDLAASQVEIRYEEQDGPSTLYLTGEEIIREFAAPLNTGTTPEEIEGRLQLLLEHRLGNAQAELSRQYSSQNVILFLEVFEIAGPDLHSSKVIELREDKKYLLKAAFKPLSKVLIENLDDKIPF